MESDEDQSQGLLRLCVASNGSKFEGTVSRV